MTAYTFIGPITQLLTMSGLPLRGPIADSDLPLIENCGMLLRDKQIMEIGDYTDIKKKAEQLEADEVVMKQPCVVAPGWIDAHTHICFAGSRAQD